MISFHHGPNYSFLNASKSELMIDVNPSIINIAVENTANNKTIIPAMGQVIAMIVHIIGYNTGLSFIVILYTSFPSVSIIKFLLSWSG